MKNKKYILSLRCKVLNIPAKRRKIFLVDMAKEQKLSINQMARVAHLLPVTSHIYNSSEMTIELREF